MAIKFLDQNGLLYFWQNGVKPLVATKVDKVEGKGLSTNDFSDELLAKLNGIAEGGQVNVIETVKVNGVALSVADKAVDIAVPTKVSELENDSKYLTVVSEENLDAELAEKVNAASEGNHSHLNKELLDTYTQTEADLADAVAKKHEHANKAELDLIASGDKAKWDQAVSDLAGEITRAKAAEEANAAAAKAADDKAVAAQGEIDALEAKVGTVPADTTVVEMIEAAQEAATYDDTAIVGRVAAIEADYLKAADKTALEGKITDAQAAAEKVATDLNSAMDTRVKAIEGDYLKTADKTELTNAIATAKQEAIEAVLDGVTDDFDTLKEVAAWIQSDTTNSAALVARVDTIEKDYLKAADKTALQDQIDDLNTKVDTGDVTVSAYVESAINAAHTALSNSEIDAIIAA